MFGFSFAVSFGAVVSPGPVSAAIITEAPRQGWRVGPLVAFGHALLELLMVLLISFGLAAVLAAPGPRVAIALGGGLMLLVLGAGYLYGAWRGILRLPEPDRQAPRRSSAALFGLGLLTTLSNPFWYAWWVTVAAGYLMQAHALGPAGVVTFYLAHESADFSWDTLLAAATSTGRRWLTPRRYRTLVVITGGFMIYFGLVFIRSAFPAT